MGRRPDFSLISKQQRQIRQFMAQTKDKREYRAADGLLLRAEGKSADNVAHRLGVTIKQVFVWTRKFRSRGVVGLRMKKSTGRKTTKADAAKPIISKIIDKDPEAFGYLKGRWVLRDISRELKKEGIDMHWTSVARMLDELDIRLKSPRLRAPGSIKKNYHKRKEIRRYKRIAPALLKKRSLLVSKMKNGLNYSQKSNDVGRKREKLSTSQRLATTNE